MLFFYIIYNKYIYPQVMFVSGKKLLFGEQECVYSTISYLFPNERISSFCSHKITTLSFNHISTTTYLSYTY